MSRFATLPEGAVNAQLSESSSSIAEKSAFPIPTIMMDKGKEEADTIASFVLYMSEIAPSVRMSRMK